MEVSYVEQQAWNWAFVRLPLVQRSLVTKDQLIGDLDGEHEDILIELHTEYGHMEYGEKQCYGGYNSLMLQLNENSWKHRIVSVLF